MGKIISDQAQLLALVKQISTLLDTDKDALSFWPPAKICEKIERQKLWASVDSSGEVEAVLVYGGVYPIAKIEAIITAESARNKGIASQLFDAFKSKLEHDGYKEIQAHIATDLNKSLNFYESQGFEQVRLRDGGKTKKRKISVHAMLLESPSLFSVEHERGVVAKSDVFRSDFYIFDLNVLLSTVRKRNDSEYAQKLFRAALEHQIKMRVSDEFVRELERSTPSANQNDPLLGFARHLPRAPSVDSAKLEQLSKIVLCKIFGEISSRNKNYVRSISDARHVSQAILSGSLGFITSDKKILDARAKLFEQYQIDIIHPSEFDEILNPDLTLVNNSSVKSGIGFEVRTVDRQLAESSISKQLPSGHKTAEYLPKNIRERNEQFFGVFESEEPVALSSISIENSVPPKSISTIVVDTEIANARFYVDHLIQKIIQTSLTQKANRMNLLIPPGQYVVREMAKSHGFNQISQGCYEKYSFGYPITPSNSDLVAKTAYRSTGKHITIDLSEGAAPNLSVRGNSGALSAMSAIEAETVFSPTLFFSSARDAVVVPIRKKYTNDLLGTVDDQPLLPLWDSKDVQFSPIKCFVNSPRTSPKLKVGMPLFFYESSKGGGTKTIRAVGRIIDTSIVDKNDIPNKRIRQMAIDASNEFSASEKVLLTIFDSLFVFPRDCPLDKMKQLGVNDPANLVSPYVISGDAAIKLIDWGWNNG